MTLKIYKIDASPPVRAVLMMAEILKLDYEPQEINIMAGDTTKPDFVEKNPVHTIPLLQDGDFFLADSHAIMTYLISKYGGEEQAKWYPNDLALRATIDQRMFFDASIPFPSLRDVVKGIKQGAAGPTPQHIKDFKAAYDILEKYLKKTKFVACDHLTVADLSILSTISSMDILVPIDAKYTRIHAWWNGLKEENWYKKGNLPGWNQLQEFLKVNMKNNSESA